MALKIVLILLKALAMYSKAIYLQTINAPLQIISTNAQHSIKQYLHLTGVGPYARSSGLLSLPTVGVAQRQPVTVPSPGLSSLSALSLPTLISALQGNIGSSSPPPPLIPISNSPQPNVPNGGLDSNVINNLAIALQLLILSNIMNNPPSEIPEASYEVAELNYPTAQKSQNFQQPSAPHPQSVEPQYAMPNSNFVGSSGFADGPNPIYGYPNKATLSRNSMNLMSPYEALAPSSPYSDPILSYRTNDFQSPYASILGDTGDLFSMKDLY